MSHIGIGGNLIQPNKQCLSCNGKGSVTRSEKYIICPQCKNKIVIDAVR